MSATGLTDRQQKVLELLAKGLTVREVAIKFGVSTQAVYQLKQRAAACEPSDEATA